MGQDAGKMVVVSGGAVPAQGATLICSRLAHRLMLLGKATAPLPFQGPSGVTISDRPIFSQQLPRNIIKRRKLSRFVCFAVFVYLPWMNICRGRNLKVLLLLMPRSHTLLAAGDCTLKALTVSLTSSWSAYILGQSEW